jgi:D-alanyl-D-alanine carboxypeptidase/D-alanyl-D-alanine-endopeptidase (penicillin-binding protein 4)
MKRAGTIALLACLSAAPAFAGEAANPLLAEVEQALDQRCLDPAQTGISIIELPGGKPVYTRNAEIPLLPASVIKLLTTAAALHHLGPEFHFHTEVLHSGQRQGETIAGDLILRGGGDPLLTPEKLWQIASNLRGQGIRQVTGNLVADASFFDAYDRAPGWDEVRSQRAYDAKIGALSVNFNIVAAHVRPAEQIGDPPSVWLAPAPQHLRIDNQAKTIAKGKNTLQVTRGDSVIKVSGNLPQASEDRVVYLNIEDPARFAAETFRAALAEAGITVAGETLEAAGPPGASLLYRHYSPPLSTVLKELNTFSNNFIAEQVVKTLGAEKVGGPGSHADGLRLIADFLVAHGVNTRGLVLADGSGLSRQNRFTAQAMTDFLAAMLPRFDIGPDFMSAMRVFGAEGSFSRRLKDSPARGKIRAKTGTLSGVSNLAGYVSSADGRLFAYALFLNNNRCGGRGADEVENRILDALYQFGDGQPKPTTLANRGAALWSPQ